MPAMTPGLSKTPLIDKATLLVTWVWEQWLTANVPAYGDGVPLQGTVNGVNKVFTLPQAPTPATSLKVYVAAPGQNYQRTTAFTLSGVTVTFTLAPANGSSQPIADYRY